jgi:hypothetical protein
MLLLFVATATAAVATVVCWFLYLLRKFEKDSKFLIDQQCQQIAELNNTAKETSTYLVKIRNHIDNIFEVLQELSDEREDTEKYLFEWCKERTACIERILMSTNAEFHPPYRYLHHKADNMIVPIELLNRFDRNECQVEIRYADGKTQYIVRDFVDENIHVYKYSHYGKVTRVPVNIDTNEYSYFILINSNHWTKNSKWDPVYTSDTHPRKMIAGGKVLSRPYNTVYVDNNGEPVDTSSRVLVLDRTPQKEPLYRNAECFTEFNSILVLLDSIVQYYFFIDAIQHDLALFIDSDTKTLYLKSSAM